jgi:hypothetical protein
LFSFLKLRCYIILISLSYIGALRLCLHGEKGSDELPKQKRYQLDELDVCTLFYKDNETIGLSTYFSIHLIKVINVTEPLKAIDDTNYSGRWAPNIKYVDDFSDKNYFEKDGQYLRYASLSTTFKLQLKEEFYFLQNNQSPIVRLYQFIFHTFLFIFLVIDIFAMVFVIYKLVSTSPSTIFIRSSRYSHTRITIQRHEDCSRCKSLFSIFISSHDLTDS